MSSMFDFSKLSVLYFSPDELEYSRFIQCLRLAEINNIRHSGTLKYTIEQMEHNFFDIVIVDERLGNDLIHDFIDAVQESETTNTKINVTRFILASEKPSGACVLNSMKLGFSSVLAVPAATVDIMRHIAYALTRFEPSTFVPGQAERPQLDSLFDMQHENDLPQAFSSRRDGGRTLLN